MRRLDDPQARVWQAVVDAAPGATFFHSPAWASLIAAAFPGYRTATQVFELADGARAVVPLVARAERNGYFRWCESMFPGGYGGALAERPLTPAEGAALYRRLLSPATAYLHILGNPYANTAVPAGFTATEQHTHCLDLRPGFEALEAGFADEKRRGCRKAGRLGVRLSVAGSPDEFRAYAAVYADTLQRWGGRALFRYPAALFDHLHGLGPHQLRLWLARVDGRVVSGAIVLYQNTTAIYWHGATLQGFLRHHPATLVLAGAVQDACARGFRYFDFGASGGLPGVEAFKEGFGAVRRPFASYVWQANPVYRTYHGLRRLLTGAGMAPPAPGSA